jgi:hypothetical protein
MEERWQFTGLTAADMVETGEALGSLSNMAIDITS